MMQTGWNFDNFFMISWCFVLFEIDIRCKAESTINLKIQDVSKKYFHEISRFRNPNSISIVILLTVASRAQWFVLGN